MEVGFVLALAFGLTLGQEVRVEEGLLAEVRVEEGLLAEDYEDYDYYYQLEDFQAAAHPQLTHRYDVPGYSDLQCEGERQAINILSVKFGHSRQDLDVNHCVTDFTQHYRENLCKTSSCRSPTLAELGSRDAVQCPSPQTPMGLWEIYYVCEVALQVEGRGELDTGTSSSVLGQDVESDEEREEEMSNEIQDQTESDQLQIKDDSREKGEETHGGGEEEYEVYEDYDYSYKTMIEQTPPSTTSSMPTESTKTSTTQSTMTLKTTIVTSTASALSTGTSTDTSTTTLTSTATTTITSTITPLQITTTTNPSTDRVVDNTALAEEYEEYDYYYKMVETDPPPSSDTVLPIASVTSKKTSPCPTTTTSKTTNSPTRKITSTTTTGPVTSPDKGLDSTPLAEEYEEYDYYDKMMETDTRTASDPSLPKTTFKSKTSIPSTTTILSTTTTSTTQKPATTTTTEPSPDKGLDSTPLPEEYEEYDYNYKVMETDALTVSDSPFAESSSTKKTNILSTTIISSTITTSTIPKQTSTKTTSTATSTDKSLDRTSLAEEYEDYDYYYKMVDEVMLPAPASPSPSSQSTSEWSVTSSTTPATTTTATTTTATTTTATTTTITYTTVTTATITMSTDKGVDTTKWPEEYEDYDYFYKTLEDNKYGDSATSIPATSTTSTKPDTTIVRMSKSTIASTTPTIATAPTTTHLNKTDMTANSAYKSVSNTPWVEKHEDHRMLIEKTAPSYTAPKDMKAHTSRPSIISTTTTTTLAAKSTIQSKDFYEQDLDLSPGIHIARDSISTKEISSEHFKTNDVVSYADVAAKQFSISMAMVTEETASKQQTTKKLLKSSKETEMSQNTLSAGDTRIQNIQLDDQKLQHRLEIAEQRINESSSDGGFHPLLSFSSLENQQGRLSDINQTLEVTNITREKQASLKESSLQEAILEKLRKSKTKGAAASSNDVWSPSTDTEEPDRLAAISTIDASIGDTSLAPDPADSQEIVAEQIEAKHMNLDKLVVEKDPQFREVTYEVDKKGPGKKTETSLYSPTSHAQASERETRLEARPGHPLSLSKLKKAPEHKAHIEEKAKQSPKITNRSHSKDWTVNGTTTSVTESDTTSTPKESQNRNLLDANKQTETLAFEPIIRDEVAKYKSAQTTQNIEVSSSNPRQTLNKVKNKHESGHTGYHRTGEFSGTSTFDSVSKMPSTRSVPTFVTSSTMRPTTVTSSTLATGTTSTNPTTTSVLTSTTTQTISTTVTSTTTTLSTATITITPATTKTTSTLTTATTSTSTTTTTTPSTKTTSPPIISTKNITTIVDNKTTNTNYSTATVTEDTNNIIFEEKIEAEINAGIDQLKSELKMLLVFNDNMKEASHQIVKEATKAKVETFFKSVTNSLNMLNRKKPKIDIENKGKVSDKPKEERTEAKKAEDILVATNILSITKDISAGLAATVELGSQMEIQLPDISMAVMKKRLNPSGSALQQKSVWRSEELSVELPDQSSIAGADSSITLAFTSYNSLGSMMTKTREVSSPVLSVNVIGLEEHAGRSIPLTKPLEFVLKHQNMTGFSHRKCVYWDFELDTWSQSGCYPILERSSADRTSCQCYHLTNFAVLVDVYGLAKRQEHKGTLDILTHIGCGISLVCLVVCIGVFTTFRSAQNDRSSINTNLCACLLVAELVFLLGIGQTDFPSLCSVVAVILHYLFLASFFWMLIAGFQIYVLLVEVFEPDNNRYVQYYMLGYIAPLLMVLFSLLVDTLFNNVSVYGSTEFCWIRSNIHLVLTFLAPVFCIVCVNIYFLSVAVWKIHLHSRDSLITHKSRTASLKLYVKGLFGLLFLLGATWSVGLLSVTYPSVTITYIFTLLNSLQGFFIFIFNCIMNKKIRKEGKNHINSLLSWMMHTKKRSLLSRNGSTASNSSNTDSTMVKEYFLPELPYTTGPAKRDGKNSNLSITYYY